MLSRARYSPDPSGKGSAVGGPVTAGTADSHPGADSTDPVEKTNADIASIGTAPGSTEGGADNPPVTGQLPGVAGKVVGAGLKAGSTDFGSGTRDAVGGKTSAGQTSSRSVSTGVGSAAASPEGGSAGGTSDTLDPGESPSIGAAGASVLNTGRPTQAGARTAIGGAALSGGGAPTEDAMSQDPGGSTRTASDPSGVGTLGGGTAGTGATRPGARTADMVEGRVAPDGTQPGTGASGMQSAAEATPQTPDDIANTKKSASLRPNPGGSR